MKDEKVDYSDKAINEGILTELGQNGFMFGYKTANKDIQTNIRDRINELRVMQIQASDDYEFCLQMEYGINELKKLI